MPLKIEFEYKLVIMGSPISEYRRKELPNQTMAELEKVS